MLVVLNSAPALLGASGFPGIQPKQAGFCLQPVALASWCIPPPSFEGETAGVAGVCSLQLICEAKGKLDLFPGLLLLFSQ